MITSQVIDAIYKQYDRRPQSTDCLDFATLFEKAGLNHDILVDPETDELTIGSISPESPFHTISLKNVHAFVPFEEWVAIVMHSSIVFLNAREPKVSIHIKPHQPSLWQRLFAKVV